MCTHVQCSRYELERGLFLCSCISLNDLIPNLSNDSDGLGNPTQIGFSGIRNEQTQIEHGFSSFVAKDLAKNVLKPISP